MRAYDQLLVTKGNFLVRLLKKIYNSLLVYITTYMPDQLNFAYSVVSIKRTGSLNYFEVFAPP
jgi:hypothetical protein